MIERLPRRRLVVVMLVALLVAGAAWYGVAPPRSAAAYADRAEQTVEALQSQAASAALWVQAAATDRTTRATAVVALESLDADAQATAAKFAGWDPPPGSDSVHDQVTDLAGQVTSALSALRVSVHRGEWAALTSVAAPLASLQPRLRSVLADLRRAGG